MCLYRNRVTLVSTRKSPHVAHVRNPTRILEKRIRNVFCAQGIAWHQNRGGIVAGLSINMSSRHYRFHHLLQADISPSTTRMVPLIQRAAGAEQEQYRVGGVFGSPELREEPKSR
jgi:hypothetical protein